MRGMRYGTRGRITMQRRRCIWQIIALHLSSINVPLRFAGNGLVDLANSSRILEPVERQSQIHAVDIGFGRTIQKNLCFGREAHCSAGSTVTNFTIRKPHCSYKCRAWTLPSTTVYGMLSGSLRTNELQNQNNTLPRLPCHRPSLCPNLPTSFQLRDDGELDQQLGYRVLLHC